MASFRMSKSGSITASNTTLNDVCFITMSTSSMLFARILLRAQRTSFLISFLGVSSSLNKISSMSLCKTCLHCSVPEDKMLPMIRRAGICTSITSVYARNMIVESLPELRKAWIRPRSSSVEYENPQHACLTHSELLQSIRA